MWIAKDWRDYELLDCGGGEKLERWDKQILVRPDPRAAIPAAPPAAVTGTRASCRRAGRYTIRL